jgi:hypothetical protein
MWGDVDAISSKSGHPVLNEIRFSLHLCVTISHPVFEAINNFYKTRQNEAHDMKEQRNLQGNQETVKAGGIRVSDQ